MVKIRRAYEGLFLGLFLFFLLITDLRYLKGWPVSLFLEATPLVAVATALTTHTIYRNLVWGLVIIAITMMLGRVWCNWMCPFGILHHIFGIIGNRRNTKQMIEVNRYRKIYTIKYYILAAMIAMAGLWIIPTTIDAPGKIWQVYHGAELKQSGLSRVFAAVGSGIAQSADEHKLGNSSLQIGLLDPIALTVRSITTSVLPTVDKATESVYTEPREYWQAWIVGLIFIGFLFANWWIPRFFCRAICPLGALWDCSAGSRSGESIATRCAARIATFASRAARAPPTRRLTSARASASSASTASRIAPTTPSRSGSCRARPARSPIRPSAAASCCWQDSLAFSSSR